MFLLFQETIPLLKKISQKATSYKILKFTNIAKLKF